MKCANCGCSVFDKPLMEIIVLHLHGLNPYMRVNPKGEDGIFWCEDCVKKIEPELYKNEIEDGGDLMNILKDVCYGTRI